jgi:triphosphatase
MIAQGPAVRLLHGYAAAFTALSSSGNPGLRMPNSDDGSMIGREIELKLELSPPDLHRITEAALRAGGPAQTMTLTSVYFDTPKQTLRRAGVSLRVRHDGDRRVQTVKADGGSSVGLFDRSEQEFVIAGDVPDLGGDRGALDELIGKKALRKIAPVFRSEVTRVKTLADTGDTAIELVVDHGSIATDDDSVPLCEVELELKHGDPASLFAFARQLDEVAALRLGVLSKADRGYQLLAPGSSGPSKAEPVVLDSRMTAASAFRAIASSCVRHYRLNETILSATGDANALHQARVALRRLRSAFTLFRSVVADEHHARLRLELRWLAAVLGDARNLDVLIERSRDAALLERLGAARIAAYQAVDEALASSRARRLMLDLAEWLTLTGSQQSVNHDDQLVLAFATDRLGRLRKRLKKDGAALAELSDDHRHQVRIEAKKLRYATEFFTSLFPGKQASSRLKRFRDALETFQGILGDLNDQTTGHLVLQQLGLADLAPDTGGTAVDRVKLIDRAVAGYEDLIGVKAFW